VADADVGVTLRLLWPQWQGAGTSSVRQLASEFPFDVARRGYAVGSAVLDAVLAPNDGPTATAPVTMGDEGAEERDGVEAKAVIVEQLARALEVIREHDPARIATLGGECAVSVAPFSALAHRYGDDLAIVWIDSHPDVGTPASEYPGFHAMAVAALTGHGDPDVQELLPATVSGDRFALVGLHSWTEDDVPNVAAWGIHAFSPDDVRDTTRPLVDWLAGTGCSRVAIHFDVDTIAAADVVGLTIAEFFPRQVMHLQQILDGFPLISGPASIAWPWRGG
jgi:arginase